MRKTLSIGLVVLMVKSLAPAAFGAEDIASQIKAIPTGARIELRLKNKQKMRGARGPVMDSGFTLVDMRTGEHQIAFDDVASVKQVTKKSHLTRNILIVVVIVVAALGITVAVALRCGPFGCGHLKI